MTIRWLDAAPFAEFEEVLREQRPDHYPEFEEALARWLGPPRARAFAGGSGVVYRVRLLPEGHAVVERAVGAAADAETVDRDLWSFLGWLIETVGGEWTVDALQETGRIYRVPGVAPETGTDPAPSRDT